MTCLPANATYIQLVSHCLQLLVDRGLSCNQIATLLGLQNRNVVSMHLHHPGFGLSPFPLTRLPALCAAVGLSPSDCAAMADARAKDHPEQPTRIDEATLVWLRSNRPAPISVPVPTGVVLTSPPVGPGSLVVLAPSPRSAPAAAATTL